jgi:hypothetical protein
MSTINNAVDNILTNGTLNGTTTFTSTSNQLILGTTNTTTVSFTAPASSLTYTFPDAGSNANVLLSQGSQTIAGSNTFTSTLKINPISNQLILGGVSAGNTTTISATAPASSLTYTFPDVGGNANVILSAGAQTIGGSKTFSSGITISPTTNQLILGTTNTTTISATAPSVSRTYTIPDAGGAANFIMSAGTQTIGGNVTFTNAIAISATSNQFILGGTNTVTLNINGPASSVIYTVPNFGSSANFVMTIGDQSLAGNKSFSDAISISATSNQLIFSTTHGTTINVPDPSAARLYTIPDAGGSANFLMSAGAQTIAGSNTFTTALTINPVSNQLVLGGVSAGNTTTISATAPASSATYTIPDVGTSANFIMSTGTQTISGAKTFSSSVLFSNATPIIMNGGGSTTTTLVIAGPVGNVIYTFPDAGTNANVLLSQGAQTIAGVNTFSGGILFATTGGTAANLNYYEKFVNSSAVFTSTMFSGTQTTTFTLLRIGGLVIFSMIGFSGSASGTSGPIISQTSPATTIPSRFLPTINGTAEQLIQIVSAGTTNNGNGQQMLTMLVTTGGAIQFYVSANPYANFTNSSTYAVPTFTTSWSIT